jgi:hypothetical protein
MFATSHMASRRHRSGMLFSLKPNALERHAAALPAGNAPVCPSSELRFLSEKDSRHVSTVAVPAL